MAVPPSSPGIRRQGTRRRIPGRSPPSGRSVDERLPRRRAADSAPLGERVAGVEILVSTWDRRLEEHLRSTERVHSDLQTLIQKLDERADRQDIRYARLTAALAAIVTLGQLLAPIILREFGVRT